MLHYAYPMRKLVIFDFDGTIADSTLLIVGAYNTYAHAHGLKPIPDDPAEQEKLRDKGSRELLSELGIRWYQIPFVTHGVRALLREKRLSLAPCSNIVDVLRTLKEEGCSLALLSSSPSYAIDAFVQRYTPELFGEVLANVPLFKKRKALLRTVKKMGFSPSESVYVGDETRDMEAAKQAGLRAVGVTWGANSEKALERAGADEVAERSENLIELIK